MSLNFSFSGDFPALSQAEAERVTEELSRAKKGLEKATRARPQPGGPNPFPLVPLFLAAACPSLPLRHRFSAGGLTFCESPRLC